MYESNPSAPHPRLDALGIVYVCLGVLDLFWSLLAMAGTAFNAMSPAAVGPGVNEAYLAGQQVGAVVGGVLSFLAIPVGALTIVAGLRMRRAQSHGLCLTAVVLNLLPCHVTACCGLFGIPLGIWAIIVLFDDQVKATFR